jgi:hypothetical protein
MGGTIAQSVSRYSVTSTGAPGSGAPSGERNGRYKDGTQASLPWRWRGSPHWATIRSSDCLPWQPDRRHGADSAQPAARKRGASRRRGAYCVPTHRNDKCPQAHAQKREARVLRAVWCDRTSPISKRRVLPRLQRHFLKDRCSAWNGTIE